MYCHSSEEIQKLTEELNNQKETLKQAEEHLNKIETEQKTLESEKQQLTKQKQMLDDKHADYVNQLDILNSKLTNTENLLREAQSKTQADDAKLQKFQSELNELQRYAEEVADDLARVSQQCENLQETR